MRNTFLSLVCLMFFLGCSTTPPPTSQSISSVTICNQVWMNKNLDVSTYRNGDPIPEVTDTAQWANLTTGAWCYYNNDPANGPIYGKLYNWYAVNDPRGLAPLGWHIPTDAEWTILSNCLGGESVAGGKMKSTIGWNSPNTGATNSSGFAGLPGGYCGGDGKFYKVGLNGVWWSSSELDITYASHRFLYYLNASVGIYDDGVKSSGFSIRCIKN